MIELLQKYKFINTNNRINPNLFKIKDNYPEFVNEIVKQTSFLEGNPSLQERIFVIISNVTAQPKCKHCNTPLRFQPSKKMFLKYCSTKCAANDIEVKQQKNQKCSLVKNQTIEKIKYTKAKQSKSQKLTVKQKRIETINNRYGSVDKLIQHNKDQQKKTNIEKYGVEFTSQNETIKQKIKQNHNKTNKDVEINNKEWLSNQHLVLQKSIGEIADTKKVSKHLIWTRMNNFNINVNHYFKSKPQQTIIEFLTNNNIEYSTNLRNMLPNNKELDIFIPSKNLAIEVNGVYWHSELNGKGCNYHLEKTNLCKSKNIRLLHFWNNEIIQKLDIVKSIILNQLQTSTDVVYGRRCKAIELSSTDAKTFHDINHLAGGLHSKYNYGLMYNDNLIQVISLSKNRFTNDHTLEIVRLSSKLNHRVIGGFSKLLCHTLKTLNPASIITYNDLRYTTGEVYNKTGFAYCGTTKPNYFYFERGAPNKLFSRISFQKHKLKNILNVFDPSTSEWENMKANNYDRVWDCGNGKWILKIKHD